MIDRPFARATASLAIALAIAACSGAATPPPQGGGGGGSTGGSSAAGSGPPAAAGAEGFEGALTSSGLYSATWSVPQGAEANPFNASANPSLASDKNTFGNIKVEPDGSVDFGSAAPELATNLSFTGTGAKVTLDPSGQFVCAFTVDTDLKGTRDSAVLHLSGTMTVHWHPGVGGLDCP